MTIESPAARMGVKSVAPKLPSLRKMWVKSVAPKLPLLTKDVGKVGRSEAPLLTKEGCRRFVGGVVL